MQYLYQAYSALNLSKISDRSKAVLGLQKRIGRQFGSAAQHGVLLRWLERTMLWHAETPGSLTTIKYDPGSAVPSWSWMAYQGRIGFLEVPFGGVHWTDHIRHPEASELDDIHWDGRLHVKSNELIIQSPELMKRCRLDGQDHGTGDSSWRCVVVGQESPMDGDGIVHYVLLIRPASTVETNEVYARVGVATLLDEHFSAETRFTILI